MTTYRQKVAASVLPECLCLWLLWSNDALPLRLPTATLKSAETPRKTRKALARPRSRLLSITILTERLCPALCSLLLLFSQWSSAPTEPMSEFSEQNVAG